jgi:hypothetical protein
MLFVRPVAFLSFVAFALSKPLGAPVVIPRQNAPLTPDQTVCGDIIVHAKNGKESAEKVPEDDVDKQQVLLYSMRM